MPKNVQNYIVLRNLNIFFLKIAKHLMVVNLRIKKNRQDFWTSRKLSILKKISIFYSQQFLTYYHSDGIWTWGEETVMHFRYAGPS